MEPDKTLIEIFSRDNIAGNSSARKGASESSWLRSALFGVLGTVLVKIHSTSNVECGNSYKVNPAAFASAANIFTVSSERALKSIPAILMALPRIS
jgi:hypothetical protein